MAPACRLHKRSRREADGDHSRDRDTTRQAFARRSRACCRALVLTVLSYALSRFFVRSGVELVWLTESTYSADRRPALLEGDEATIAATEVPTVNSAPFIGVSGGRTDNEE
jgi:hypothetical protein